jgi:hypothetical protein
MKTKLNSYRLTLLTSLTVLLSACGSDVIAVYEQGLYHTNTFALNFYQDQQKQQLIDKTLSTTVLDIASNHILTTLPNGYVTFDDYAMANRLANDLPLVGYGVESKLFDGLLFCRDDVRLSKSRLQLLPSGFGYVFPQLFNPIDNQTIGLFMKAGADTNDVSQPRPIQSLIVHLTFYIPMGENFIAQTFNLAIEDLVPSGLPGYYAFVLPENTTIQGAHAFSFTYTIVSPLPTNEQTSLTGLFLYEIIFPSANWA